MNSFKLPNAKRIPTGTIEVASFAIPRIYQADYRELVKKSPDSLDLELSIHKKPRSTGRYSQGNHFNGHIQQICMATGNEFDDVKLYVKRIAMKRGLRWATKENGDILYSLNDLEPLPISESEMTSEECSWCIEESHILAAQLGIELQE